MARELKVERPDLQINVLGMNQKGHESGNEIATENHVIPWLQDEDKDGDGSSDIWLTAWPVAYRDVIILDANNVQIDVYNLTTHDLKNGSNYDTMKQKLIAAAEANKPTSSWTNPANPLDVNDDTFVSPIDALLIINELNTVGGHPLSPSETPTDYLDTNSDFYVSPLDALLILNYLNATPPAAAPAAVPGIITSDLTADASLSSDLAPSTQDSPVTSPMVAAAIDALWDGFGISSHTKRDEIFVD